MNKNINKLHILVAIVVIFFSSWLAWRIYVLKDAFQTDIPHLLTQSQESQNIIGDFYYLCGQYLHTADEVELLSDTRIQSCSAILSNINYPESKDRQTELVADNLFNARQLFGKLLYIHRSVATPSARSHRLTAQLNSELLHTTHAVTSDINHLFIAESKKVSADIQSEWASIFILAVAVAAASYLVVVAYYGNWESSSAALTIKIFLLFFVGIYFSLHITKRTTQSTISFEGSQVFDQEQVELSLERDPDFLTNISVTAADNFSSGSKEWLLTNSSNKPARLLLSVRDIRNLENDCSYVEKKVDQSCEADQGELGDYVSIHVAFKFGSIQLPFSSFTIDHLAQSKLKEDWQKFIQLSQTFAANEQSIDIMQPGEQRTVLVNWKINGGYGNEIQSDSTAFKLYFQVVPAIDTVDDSQIGLRL